MWLVNPEQAIVIAFDQSLFALAKKVQWVYPDRYGSDKFVVTMHIEMLFLKLIGDWLEDSGWITVIHNSGVTEDAGTADSKVVMLVKQNLFNQVSFCLLQIFLQCAYDRYLLSCGSSNEALILSFGLLQCEWNSCY